MEIVYLLILGIVVAGFVTYPFWGKGEVTVTEDPELAGLRAARDAKYREIRDAETDLASGKLNRADFDRVNADLRRDAVDILDRLEDAEADAKLKGQSGRVPDRTGPGLDEEPPKSGDS